MNANTNSIGNLQSDAAHGLSFRLRQPAPAAPKKCVILLHGVGGNETNLIDFANEIDAETLVVFPRGPLQIGSDQYAWFRVTFTAAGPRIVAEEAEQSRQTLVQFVEQLQRQHAVTAANTIIAGFSQGGILSASVALTAPERVAGFGLLSGRILPEIKPQLASPQRLAKLKAFVGHGQFDSKLPVDWANRSEKLLIELGVHHALHLYPIDHGISAEMQADFMQWLRTQA